MYLILFQSKIYVEYIDKYLKKLQITFDNKVITDKDLKYLEKLEKDLTLESILDAREYANEKFKVIHYFWLFRRATIENKKFKFNYF